MCVCVEDIKCTNTYDLLFRHTMAMCMLSSTDICIFIYTVVLFPTAEKNIFNGDDDNSGY
jgi:hypothetical protein